MARVAPELLAVDDRVRDRRSRGRTPRRRLPRGCGASKASRSRLASTLGEFPAADHAAGCVRSTPPSSPSCPRSRGWWPRCCCPAACWCRTFTSRRCTSSRRIAGGNRSTSRRRCGACSTEASAGGPLRFEQARLHGNLRPRSDGGGIRSARRDGQERARGGDRAVDRSRSRRALCRSRLVTSSAPDAGARGGSRRVATRDRAAARSRGLGRERPGRARRAPASPPL